MNRCTMVARKLKCVVMRHTVMLKFLLVFWWLTLARITKWSSLVVGIRVITWVNQNLGASFLLLFALQFLLLPCLPFSIWHLIITWFRVVIIIVVFLFLAFWATWLILFLIFRFTIIILVLVLVFFTRRIDGTLGRVFARYVLLFSKQLSWNTEIQALIPIERIDTRPRGGWIGLFKNFLKNLAENHQVRMIRPYVGSFGPSQARMIRCRVRWSDKEKETCTRFEICLAFDESLWIQNWQMK